MFLTAQFTAQKGPLPIWVYLLLGGQFLRPIARYYEIAAADFIVLADLLS